MHLRQSFGNPLAGCALPLDKKTVKGQLYYLVKWKGVKVKDATWEPKPQLIEDGLIEYTNAYEQKLKDKAKKAKVKKK